MILSEPTMGNGDFELPENIRAVLPSDPFEQLDVARRITSMAIASRLGKLESEEKKVSQKVAEKERIIMKLQERLAQAEQTLQETAARLEQALEEQERMANEKNHLMATVKRLNRDVAKLETFKKTLMQSLQEEEDHPVKVEKVYQGSVARNGASETVREDATASNQRMYLMTPPRRQSPKREPLESGMRSSFALSLPASQATTAPNSPPHTGSLPVRTPKVDGKEFFRQARSRLSYEQFSAFLASIKELNAHRQSREETLRKADEIFGSENKDLYGAFERLLGRHLPS